MYSSHPYSHKQILSTGDLDSLFGFAGIETVQTDVVMELSLPCENYLTTIFRSKRLARLTAPLANPFFTLLRIRNKMISVGKKRGGGDRVDH